MSHYLIEQITSIPNIHFRLRSEVIAASGSTHLEAITIADRVTGSEVVEPATFLSVMVGASPHTDWIGEAVAHDAQGFILSGPEVLRDDIRPRWTAAREPYLLETSLPGVFVAGDARRSSMKRVAAAVGEGAIAVHLVHQYLDKM
jgi:thioredoxin reductase (NADPH)